MAQTAERRRIGPGRRTNDLEQVVGNVGLLGAILTASGDAIFATDLTGTVVSWNPAAERLLGYTGAQVIGRHVAFLSPPGPSSLVSQLEDPGSEVAVIRADSDLLVADGRRLPVSWTMVPITDDGLVVGAAVVCRDASQQRDIEDGLRRNQLHKERNKIDLLRVNKELREIDTFKTHFMVMASHELRTPLTAILGFSEFFANHWDRVDDQAKREGMTTVHHQAQRVARLVRNFETAARIEAGALGDHLEPVNVLEAIESALRELEDLGDDAAISCSDDLWADVDGDHLQQMLVAYLSNASIHGLPPVSVVVTADDDLLSIEVRDHGPGPSAAVKTTLFDAFASVNIPRSNGFGLSLAIVRQVARAYGGNAWFERRRECTVFAIRVPRHNR